MRTNFSPSINIIRDVDTDFYYVPTSNSKATYEQIAKQFNTGIHSFNIVGSYGTGKSAFLLALSKHLRSEKNYFGPINGQFNGCKQFDFLNIVGSYGSLIEAFATALEVEPYPTVILKSLTDKRGDEKNTCQVISIDELGKFLEYAVENNPDEELYFIQQLAELANDVDSNILFISTLHQNFDAYAMGLSRSQQTEWEKVKGRLKELTFNEPVEQLLQLVTLFLEEKFGNRAIKNNEELTQCIQEAGAFNLLRTIDESLATGLYPFDLLSAIALTKALQTYGQNERSLFHFLSAEEKYGLYDYDKENNPYYNLSCVYDYLQYNYYSVLSSRHNPAYFKWSLLRNSLDRVQLELATKIEAAQKLVKAIGLLNILGTSAAKIDDALLLVYGEIALGLKDTAGILKLLLKKKIIRYQKYNDRYKLFEGTDIDIDQLIEDKRRIVKPIVDIVAELRGKIKEKIVPAKAITYRIGTPRFFELNISNTPILSFQAKDRALDGIINVIFQEDFAIAEIEDTKAEPILYGVYKTTAQLKLLLQDIKATEAALTEAQIDRVAKQELVERKNYHIDILNQAIDEDIFSSSEKIDWYFDGKQVVINSYREFNKQLSAICEVLFTDTPVFRNELMNKQKPSSVINSSRKRYFEQLLDNYSLPGLGFPKAKHPAEKTIYYTLLNHTGIHQENEQGIYAYFSTPTEESFLPLWEASCDFLKSAKLGKRFVSEFVDTLRAQPFGLKDGFIEFWIGTFLFIHREDFALFGEGYIPKFSSEVLELLFKDAHKYQVKTFNLDGIRLGLFNTYRSLVQAKAAGSITTSSFKETAAPFLVFYKQLPDYTKHTARLDEDTLTFRSVISKAKELEKTFFEDLPAAFGFTLKTLHESEGAIEKFAHQITHSIKVLREALNALVERIEHGILDILGLQEGTALEVYSEVIRKRYEPLKKHLLLPKQKVFYNRLLSQIEDKENWIKNVAHAVIGKKLEQITDVEEAQIADKLQVAFQELDDLIELGKTEVKAGEEILRVKISGTQDKGKSKNIVISAKQQPKVTELEAAIEGILSKNKKINQAALLKVLKKYL